MMIDKDKLKSIMLRIKKCLALARDKAATEGEAQSALNKANKLMEEYRIQEADLLGLQINKNDIGHKSIINSVDDNLPDWVGQISNKIDIYTNTKSFWRTGLNKNHELVRSLVICGTEFDVDIAQYFTVYLYRIIKSIIEELTTERKKYTKIQRKLRRDGKEFDPDIQDTRVYINSYRMGLVTRICERIQGMINDKQKDTIQNEQQYGLIQLKDKLVDNYMVDNFRLKKPKNHKPGRFNPNGYDDGRSRGDQVNISSGLNGSTNETRLLK